MAWTIKGIGLETAKNMARRGARVIIACQNLNTGKQALEEIQRDTRNSNLVLKHLDLSSLESVRNFCKEINLEKQRLDILVNNAGIMAVNRQLTKDNLELSMQTNHFGPFLLTHLLLDLMRRTGNARIVNTSSSLHGLGGPFDPDNLNAEKSFNHSRVYAQAKLANIYFTRELDRRLKAVGINVIAVNALHPGAVRTAIWNNMNKSWYMQILGPIQQFFFKTPLEGAQTTIYVAVSEAIEGVSGAYFQDCHKTNTWKIGRNVNNARVLWDKSVEAVRLTANDTIVPL